MSIIVVFVGAMNYQSVLAILYQAHDCCNGFHDTWQSLRVHSPNKAFKWPERISEGAEKRAGLHSGRAIDATLYEIDQHPSRFSKSKFATAEIDLHFVSASRFKYVVHFGVARNEVQVVSVAHAARSPGYWLRRRNS